MADGGTEPRRYTALLAALWNAAVPLLLVTVLLWAGNALVGRIVRDEVPPLALALARWAGALALILPFAMRHLTVDAATLRRHWRMTLLLGLLGVTCFNAFLYSALHFTTASNAMLLQSVQPAAILLLGAVFFGERAGVLRIVAVLLSVAGAAIVVSRADWRTLYHLSINRGECWCLPLFCAGRSTRCCCGCGRGSIR